MMGVLTYTLDIHGMTVQEAEACIHKTISSLSKDYGQIQVIHGYRTGNRLQDMVRKKLKSPRVKQKLLTMNPGETILVLT